MSDPHLADSGGGPQAPQVHITSPSSSTQSTLTYAKALGGQPGDSSHLRKYAEIIATQKTQRNVLELKMKKLNPLNSADQDNIPTKSLNFDDISELIFEVLNIQFEECIGVDYFTGRYDTREIMLKPEVDSSKYINSTPIIYKDHEITVKKMLNDVTKVTFKNVPMYVPDEEILHLCGVYGVVVDNKVYWEQLRVTTSTKRGVLTSPTRYVLMHLNNGAQFNNFYWMEGPMAGDPGRRVTVLHHGQAQQCSHCFLTATTGCKGAGNGKACSKTDQVRAKMSSYMQALKTTTGYETLKVKYMRQLSKNYPGLQGEPDLNTTLAEGMDAAWDVDNDEEREVTMGILPINPIVEKDREIAELIKTVESLKSRVEQIPDLEKGLEEARAENKRVLSISRQAGRRLSVSRRANEQKMISLIQTGTNWNEDSAHLACSHAAALNDDEFDLDEETDMVRPKNENFNFLKKVEENLDLKESLQEERFQEIKRLILEQMKNTIKRKIEARGEKRTHENDHDKSLSKPRLKSPPKPIN